MISEMDFLEAFPESLCESEEEKLALLSHIACSDAVAWLHELIKYMIEGQYQFILTSFMAILMENNNRSCFEHRGEDTEVEESETPYDIC
jgi:hypothetical protein